MTHTDQHIESDYLVARFEAADLISRAMKEKRSVAIIADDIGITALGRKNKTSINIKYFSRALESRLKVAYKCWIETFTDTKITSSRFQGELISCGFTLVSSQNSMRACPEAVRSLKNALLLAQTDAIILVGVSEITPVVLSDFLRNPQNTATIICESDRDILDGPAPISRLAQFENLNQINYSDIKEILTPPDRMIMRLDSQISEKTLSKISDMTEIDVTLDMIKTSTRARNCAHEIGITDDMLSSYAYREIQSRMMAFLRAQPD